MDSYGQKIYDDPYDAKCYPMPLSDIQKQPQIQRIFYSYELYLDDIVIDVDYKIEIQMPKESITLYVRKISVIVDFDGSVAYKDVFCSEY